MPNSQSTSQDTAGPQQQACHAVLGASATCLESFCIRSLRAPLLHFILFLIQRAAREAPSSVPRWTATAMTAGSRLESQPAGPR